MFTKLTAWLRWQDKRVSLTWTQQEFLNVYFPALRTLLNMRYLTVWRKILLSLPSSFSCSFLYDKCHCEQNLWFPFQKGQGAPGREPLISHEEQKQMMLYYYKKQEELKVAVTFSSVWATLQQPPSTGLIHCCCLHLSLLFTETRRGWWRLFSKRWVGRQPCFEKTISRRKRHQVGAEMKLYKHLFASSCCLVDPLVC